MNTDILRGSTITEIVNQLPGAIPVLDKMNIDFCCNGKLPFAEACRRADRTEEEVLTAILQAPPAATSAVRPQDWSLDLLTNYIVQNHHQYTKRTLPEIQRLMEKVYAKHGANHPELEEVRSLVDTLAKDLQAHMYHEEHVLFPAVNALVRECSRVLPLADSVAKSMSNLTPVMITLENEHDQAGTCLHRIHEITRHFAVPPDACSAFRALYQQLQEFEADLHFHIHLENNLLFPKTLSLQARQSEKPLYVN